MLQPELPMRGRVRLDNGRYFLSVPDDPKEPATTTWRGWMLSEWAKPYWGLWLTISLEPSQKVKSGDV